MDVPSKKSIKTFTIGFGVGISVGILIGGLSLLGLMFLFKFGG